MYVGIYDADLLNGTNILNPNVDVMKIAAYHKKNRDLVTLMLSEENWERYNKIYVRKNKMLGAIPRNLLRLDKVEYGGLFFTNGIRVPMKEEIENCQPDFTIYEPFVRLHNTRSKEKARNMLFQRTDYLRIHSKQEREPTKTNICIIDEDLGSLSDLDIIKKIEIKPKRVITIQNPIIVNSIEEGAEWINFPKFDYLTKVIYPQRVSYHDLEILKKLCPTPKLKLRTYVGEEVSFLDFEEFYKMAIEDTNKLISCKVNKLPVSFHRNPNFFIPEYMTFYRELERWTTMRFQNITIYDFVRLRDTSHLSKFNIIADQLIARNPEFEELLNTNPQIIINEGGSWDYDKHGNL